MISCFADLLQKIGKKAHVVTFVTWSIKITCVKWKGVVTFTLVGDVMVFGLLCHIQKRKRRRENRFLQVGCLE